jgi:hypothetical protein
MIPTVLAHAHATLHVHPETLAVAGACLALSLVAWRVVTGIRRRKAR